MARRKKDEDLTPPVALVSEQSAAQVESAAQPAAQAEPAVQPAAQAEPAAQPAAQAEPAAQPAAQAEESESTEAVGRVSVPITASGQIAWDAMRTDTRVKVQKMMGTADQSLTRSNAAEGYKSLLPSMFMGLQAVLYNSMAGNLPEDLKADLAVAIRYTKSELDELVPATANLLAKYMPKGFGEYEVELNFLFVFGTIHYNKYAMFTSAIESYKARTAAMNASNAQIKP